MESLEAYVDESGTHDPNGQLCVAASVTTRDLWERFESDWLPFASGLDRPFHATKHDHLLQQLAELMATHTLLAHVLTIEPATYHRIVPDWVKSAMGGPYRLSMIFTLLGVARWARANGFARVAWHVERGHREFRNVSAMLDIITNDEASRELFWIAQWQPVTKVALPIHCADAMAQQTSRCLMTNKATPFLRKLAEANLILEGNISEQILLEALPRLKGVVKQLKRDNDGTRDRLKNTKRRSDIEPGPRFE
jgi:hypothetical protein